MSIFVIGDQDTIFGLKLVGIDGKVVQAVAEDVERALDEVLSDIDPAILLITQPLARQAQATVNELKMTTLQPVVLEIPGSQPEAPTTSLRAQIEEIVGMSLRV